MSSIQDFWPPIEEAININNDPSQPNTTSHVQCPICLEAIAVTSFPPVPEREGDVLDTDPTLGEILLCGHVLCQACRVQNEGTSKSSWEDRKCPMCRTSLQCIDCGKPSQVVPIPKEGPASTVPAILTGGSRCRDCKAIAGFEESIQQGEWPEGLTDLEPGFVPLFYHLVTKMQQQNMIICQRSIVNAFSTIVEEEFGQMMDKRSDRIHEMHAALEGESPWFEGEDSSDDDETAIPPPIPDLPWAQMPARRANGQNAMAGSQAEVPTPHVQWQDLLAPHVGEEVTAMLEASQPPAQGQQPGPQEDATTQRNVQNFLGSLAARPTPRAGLRELFGPRYEEWPEPMGAPNNSPMRLVSVAARPSTREGVLAEVVETYVPQEWVNVGNNEWQAFGFDHEAVDIHVDSNDNDDEEHRSVDDTSSGEDADDESGTYNDDAPPDSSGSENEDDSSDSESEDEDDSSGSESEDEDNSSGSESEDEDNSSDSESEDEDNSSGSESEDEDNSNRNEDGDVEMTL
ncbi:hypothetical protein ACHAPO_009021 [Fusarium lateritium]